MLLIVPPRTILKSSVKRCCTPLGLAYIAAVLEENDIEVNILDCYAEGYYNEIRLNDKYIRVGLDEITIYNMIKELNPDYIGITCAFSSEIKNTIDMCQLSRICMPDAKIIVGGIHPTNYPERLMDDCPEIDYIILGEGEYRLLDLINGKLKDGVYTKEYKYPPKENIKDIDAIPFPARHLLKMDIYLKINKHISPYPKGELTEQILTSRGCPGKCIFCTSSNFWGHKFRGRSSDNVLREMKHLIDEYGIQEFQFTDDNMTLDKERAMDIFSRMKTLDISFCMANGTYVNSLTDDMIKVMAKAGCYQITFSVESGCKDSLKLMKKNVKLDRIKSLVDSSSKTNISCHATFVLGIPGETIKDIEESFRFANHSNFDSVSYFIVSPLPGSELYDICRMNGYIDDDSFDRLDFKSSMINNPELQPEMLDDMIRKANTYFIVRYLFIHPMRFYNKYKRFIKENPMNIFKIFGRVT